MYARTTHHEPQHRKNSRHHHAHERVFCIRRSRIATFAENPFTPGRVWRPVVRRWCGHRGASSLFLSECKRARAYSINNTPRPATNSQPTANANKTERSQTCYVCMWYRYARESPCDERTRTRRARTNLAPRRRQHTHLQTKDVRRARRFACVLKCTQRTKYTQTRVHGRRYCGKQREHTSEKWNSEWRRRRTSLGV